MLGILGALTEIDADVPKDCQLEDVAKARDAGVYKGRKPAVNVEAARALKVTGKGPAEILKELGIGRASVFGRWRRLRSRSPLPAQR